MMHLMDERKERRDQYEKEEQPLNVEAALAQTYGEAFAKAVTTPEQPKPKQIINPSSAL
jgi:hypothetical protein